MQVGVGRQKFFPIRENYFRPAQRREVQLAVGSDDAELVAVDARVPSHVDNTANLARVINQHGGVVFHSGVVNGARKMSAGALRLPEKVIQQINPMGPDVEEWTASCQRRVKQPGTFAILGGEPRVT